MSALARAPAPPEFHVLVIALLHAAVAEASASATIGSQVRARIVVPPAIVGVGLDGAAGRLSRPFSLPG